MAVDGYSSTGKSTVAKRIARRLGLTYIDTGAMYRAVTLAALRQGAIDAEGRIDEEQVRGKGRAETYLNGENVEREIRGMEVADQVSGIAALGFVRTFLVEQQREMGRRGDVILDGRDIGTVVFPDADVKFFLTASSEVRAKRRYEELRAKGMEVSYEEVEANVRKRDYIDSHREASPLVQAADAVVVDNSTMTVDEEVDWRVRVIEERCGRSVEHAKT